MENTFGSPVWVANIHRKQLNWPLIGRIAWWVLLTIPGVLCWAATKEDRRVRYGAYAAVAVFLVFSFVSGGDTPSPETEVPIEVAAEEGISDSADPLSGPTLEDTTDISAAPVERLEGGGTVTTEILTTTAPVGTPAPASSDALRLLSSLTVESEPARVGYDRALFAHWSDLDGDGCNTRYEVLTAESHQPVETNDGCRPVSGLWISAFDGKTTTDPSTFDIDHLVPLAEAWDSGADSWSASRREAFANDQSSSLSLIAVSASSNRSKSDRDPADWLPPSSSYHCTYVASWVSVKAQWGLSVDPAEYAAIESVLVGCGGTSVEQPVTPTTAPLVTTTAPPPTTSSTTTTTPPTTAAPTITAPPTTVAPTTTAPLTSNCHPAYSPCLPNLAGDALNCGDLSSSQKPVTVLTIGVDPYNLDRDQNGVGCTS